MRGEYCKRALFVALTPVAGITAADVSVGSITIEHDGSVTEDSLRGAISVTGYVVASIVHERRALPIMSSDAERQAR